MGKINKTNIKFNLSLMLSNKFLINLNVNDLDVYFYYHYTNNRYEIDQNTERMKFYLFHFFSSCQLHFQGSIALNISESIYHQSSTTS